MTFQNRMLAALAPSDLHRLAPALKEITVARKQVLQHAGDAIEYVYFPSSAVLCIVKPMVDGREISCHIIGDESGVGLIGAMSGLPAVNRTIVQVAGSMLRLPAAVLRRYAQESPSLMTLIHQHIDLTNSQSEQGLACSALHGAQPRLAKWLLIASQDGTTDQQVMLTQSDLAKMLGVQRTTVTAVAAAMKVDGIIRSGRGFVTILDRKRLESMACGCYNAARSRNAEVDAEWAPRQTERRRDRIPGV